MGSSKKQTVGYRYYMGIHMGLCHGPVDALLAIEAGGRTAWSGSQTAFGTITVDAPELWGGEDREGGVAALVDVMMGAPDQQPNDYLASQQGADQPAYRGLFGVVVRGPSSPTGISAGTEEVNIGGSIFPALLNRPSGLVAVNNPYLKPWAFRVRRILQGWLGGSPWYSAKASIDLGGGLLAMNPAHIVYECLTNTEWGLGYPSGQLDLATFTAAADTFHAEGLGLCMAWQQQDSLLGFIQIVMDHAGAVLVQDRTTGLFRLRAIRGDYTLASLPSFGSEDGNVLEVSRIERATYTEAVNEITVAYVDAATGKDGSVTVQQLAAIQAQGAVVPETRQYPGIPNADLALRTAMRDLRAATSGLARVSMRVNRQAYSILPGDVLRFEWLPAGIAEMAVRVASVDYGSLTDGAMTLECVEDVFSLPATSYVNPQPGGSGAITTPQASQGALAIEAPYLSLVRQVGDSSAQATPVDAGYVIAMAPRPVGSPINCVLEARVGTGEWSGAGTADWTPTATLAAEISPTATAITLSGISLGASIVVGDLVLLGSSTAHEIAQVSAFDATARTMTLRRGCLDTIPRRWFAGTRLYVFSRIAGNIETQYVDPEVVGVRFRTVASQGTLDATLAPAVTITMDQRQARPYPPGNLVINSARFPAIISGALALSWSHRDRLGQSDLVLDQLAGSTGPEAGTTYTLRLYGETGTLLRTVTGLTGTSYTWTTEAADSALPGARLNITLRVELEAVRDGLTSYMRYDVSLTRAGVADPGTVVPGGELRILGDVSQGAQAGVAGSAQLTAAGVAGSPVWSLAPGAPAGASISQSGLLSYTFSTAGTYLVDVILTDHPSLTNTVRRFRIVVEAGAAGAAGITGTLPSGYAGAPYLVNTLVNEGLVFSRPPAGNYWTITGSSGMPDNVCAGFPVAGFPTTPGTYSYTIQAAQWGTPPVTTSGSVAILAAPTATVWNPVDRYLAYSTVIFLPGTAPMLSLQAQPLTDQVGFSGRVRALNGYTTGRRYWEVRVDSLPSGSSRFAISLGVDRSAGENVNPQWIGNNPDAGEWGYVIRRANDGEAIYSAVVARNQQDRAAPAVVAGDVLRFVHDAGTGNLWIGIAGRGWIGGGNPDTNTSPTITGIAPPPSPFWPDYRPLAILGGGSDVRVTANFGSQAWAGGGPTSGASIIPFARADVYAFNYPDLDTATVDSGTTLAIMTGGISLKSGAYVQPAEQGTFASSRSDSTPVTSAATILYHLPKSAGKWQAEFVCRGRRDRTYVGVVPFDWTNPDSLLARPGFTSDSFGVRYATATNGADAGTIHSGNTQVGTLTAGTQRVTLAFDLDASPETVRVVRDGTVVGTYNLPNTGKAWALVVGGSAQGGAELFTTNIQHPQSGFTPWGP